MCISVLISYLECENRLDPEKSVLKPVFLLHSLIFSPLFLGEKRKRIRKNQLSDI
jgi:hypothetical protein